MAIIALATNGTSRVTDGLREAAGILTSVTPQLALGFLMAGFVTVLIPQATVAKLVGAESGILGLLIATVAGAFTPAEPFLQFPLAAALLKGGAAEGPVVAYLTAWSLLGLQRVPVWELAVLGPTFALARWTVSLIVQFLVGLAIPMLLWVARQP